MIPYFEKALCSVVQEIRYDLFYLLYLTNYLTSILQSFSDTIIVIVT